MRRLFLAAAVTVQCLSAQAQAPGSPEALRAAQELAAILTADTVGQMTRAMTAQIWPSIEKELGRGVNPALSAELRTEFEKSLERFTVDAMKEAPAIYARHFSALELREITAFYRTPTGAKALKAMPQVMAEYFGTLTPRMESFQRELQDSVQSILRKHGSPK